MNRDQKAAVIDEVAAQISESEAVFAVDYRGISVPQAAELRTKLRDADASFRIVKNTLTLRAADKAGAEALKELLEGPTAMTFVRGDAAAAAKALSDFRRASGGTLLQFKGGWMNGAPLGAPEIEAIAKLPSREVLYGRLVGMVASPLMRPPFGSRMSCSRRNWLSALAARATSPSSATNVKAVGPSSSSFRSSAPACSAARSVSVFLTTRKRAPASVSFRRSSAAWGTLMPR